MTDELRLLDAVRHGNTTDVRFLIERVGCDPNMTNNNDISILAIAVMNHRHETTATLLELGADPNSGNSRSGTTPLMLAARGDDIHLCRLLLDAGADPRARNNAGETALCLAACCCNPTRRTYPEILRLLIMAGTDFVTRDSYWMDSVSLMPTRAEHAVLILLAAGLTW